MHIPDGFLTAPVTAAATAAAAAGAVAAVRGAKSSFTERPVAALLGMAAVFAAQAGNFPVSHGVSAHLLGGALLGASLGFGPAFALTAPVIVVQALLGDGGIFALGPNLLNMAVVAPLVASLVAQHGGPARRGAAAFVGTFAAVLACSAELILSGRGPSLGLAADMVRLHLPVMALEGLGAFALAVWLCGSTGVRRYPVRAAAVCTAVFAIGAAFAVQSPDGLEHVAETFGFRGSAR